MVSISVRADHAAVVHDRCFAPLAGAFVMLFAGFVAVVL